MNPISKPVIWLDKAGFREYRPEDAKHIFKWVLFEREGVMYLAAMSMDAAHDLHVDLVIDVALDKGWYTSEKLMDARMNGLDPKGLTADMGVKVMGGGTKNNGMISRSMHFGAIPRRYETEVQALLGY